jgi:CRISPR-associated endonuclease/helicase Cas3
VELHTHIEHVQRQVELFADRLVGEISARGALSSAAHAHDAGKADIRFQALLHGGDPIAARLSPALLAKGVQAKRSKAIRNAQWMKPEGFRHELLSLLLLPDSAEDLVLHLVASHHGRCRPFAPVVQDSGEDLEYNGCLIRTQDRLDRAPHRLGSGVSDRFWRLTRRYGWWGLAWLETILRLADWKASKDEQCDSQQ